MDNNFQVVIQSVLEKSGVTKSLSDIQKTANTSPIELKTKIEKATTVSEFKKVADEIATELNKILGTNVSGKELTGIFKQMQNEADRTAKELTEKRKQEAIDKTVAKMTSEVNDVEFGNLKQEIHTIDTQTKALDVSGKSLGQTFITSAQNFSKWTSSSSTVVLLAQAFKKMTSNVIEINSAMVNLHKVTDETDERYQKFLDASIKKSKDLGIAVTGYVDAVSQWSKLGYSNINEASKYAEISTIYKNVGNLSSVETSIKSINSAMKAFDTTEAEHIVDVYNELGNTMGVTSADIGEGMQKAASALALTGNSMEQVASLLAGGGEITGDVTKIADAAKVGALRLAAMKQALQEIGEEYEDIESAGATQSKIYNYTKGQVDIYDAQNGKLKDTYTIWRDIANVFDDINKTEQNELLELLFGKNQANQGSAIMKGFQNGQIDKALANALNSNGSARKEYQSYMEGIQYSLDRFGVSVEKLSNTMINSDLLKFFVDLGATGVTALNGIVSAMTPLGALTVGTGITAFIKNLDWLNLQSYKESCLDFLVGLA